MRKEWCHLIEVTEATCFEISTEGQGIMKLRVVGVRRLHRFTGKASWAAGVVPRTRWSVDILYAVTTDALRGGGDDGLRGAGGAERVGAGTHALRGMPQGRIVVWQYNITYIITVLNTPLIIFKYIKYNL